MSDLKTKIKLCAFADEADSCLDGQIKALRENGITLLEIRGVDGQNIADISLEKTHKIKETLDNNGIQVWSVGSPAGKTDINADFSAEKVGALIIFERSTKLGDVIKTGTIIDAQPGAYMIKNIFFNKAPMHDGALIIRNNRLYSAGCFLPLSMNPEIMKDLGTRHRAGIGMSENSDAVVVIVSEETGIVSLAVDGHMTRDYDSVTLKRELIKLIFTDTAKGVGTVKNKEKGEPKNEKNN